MIRRLKMSYALYNYFKKRELMHNVPIYKKYGIDKKYYSSISSEDFRHIDAEEIVREGRAQSLDSIAYYHSLSKETQESIHSFDEQGYCIIRGFLDEDTVDTINGEIDHLLDTNKIDFKYGNKLMFAIHKSDFLAELWRDPPIRALLDYLIRGQAELFQSINFIKGSEQHTHSDSIHMTTFPLGGLLGVWLALEDITADNGPVHYYPRSHKLPYYLNRDYDNVGSRFLIGPKDYSAYESMIAEKIDEQGIEKKIFTAAPGDLFIWHANLLHGGNKQRDQELTRKSMVMHYFDSRRICYHEITQRPALMKYS